MPPHSALFQWGLVTWPLRQVLNDETSTMGRWGKRQGGGTSAAFRTRLLMLVGLETTTAPVSRAACVGAHQDSIRSMIWLNWSK